MTGGALNPARYLGPALVGGRLESWLVYTAGPALGGVVAAEPRGNAEKKDPGVGVVRRGPMCYCLNQ